MDPELVALRKAKFEAHRHRNACAAQPSGCVASDVGLTLRPNLSERPVRPERDDPKEQEKIAVAMTTAEFSRCVEELTLPSQKVRGLQVDPSRANLQALQNVLLWTPGGYDTRPHDEMADKKHYDRLQILLTYRQNLAPPNGELPRIVMYDYICHTIFGIPMRPVGPDVLVPDVLNLEGQIVKPAWIECDWPKFYALDISPSPALRPNRYPYQLPTRSLPVGTHSFVQQTQHWILWYFHGPHEPLANPCDAVIDNDLRCELMRVVTAEGFDSFDYVWYRNPSMSVPDVFHVQVFWIVQP